MKLARGTVLPLIAVALVVSLASAAYFFSLRITNHVEIEYPTPTPPPPPPPTVQIGIYSDELCTTPLTEIDWGILQPAQTKEYPAWIRNEGDVTVIATMRTESWNPPEAEQYMELRFTDQPVDSVRLEIPVNTVMHIVFQLAVFSNITGVTNFSFDTVITAEG